MYTVGLFHAWDFLGWIIITLAYIYAPSAVISKKNEYVTFSLIFLSIIFTLFMIIMNLTEKKEFTHMFFWVAIAPLLFIFHVLFPFRKTKKSQHLSFFLFFISGYMLVSKGLALIAFALSNM